MVGESKTERAPIGGAVPPASPTNLKTPKSSISTPTMYPPPFTASESQKNAQHTGAVMHQIQPPPVSAMPYCNPYPGSYPVPLWGGMGYPPTQPPSAAGAPIWMTGGMQHPPPPPPTSGPTPAMMQNPYPSPFAAMPNPAMYMHLPYGMPSYMSPAMPPPTQSVYGPPPPQAPGQEQGLGSIPSYSSVVSAALNGMTGLAEPSATASHSPTHAPPTAAPPVAPAAIPIEKTMFTLMPHTQLPGGIPFFPAGASVPQEYTKPRLTNTRKAAPPQLEGSWVEISWISKTDAFTNPPTLISTLEGMRGSPHSPMSPNSPSAAAA